jgi:hypothetical protein
LSYGHRFWHIASTLVLACCLLDFDQVSGQQTERIGPLNFEVMRMDVYPAADLVSNDSTAVLQMAYADYRIANPAAWSALKRKSAEVYAIDLVYSDYPTDTNRWIFHYNDLMPARIQAMLQLDPQLNSPTIRYRLVAQTQCSTAKLAKSFFHGIVIKYRPKAKRSQTLAEKAKNAVSATTQQPNSTLPSGASTAQKPTTSSKPANATPNQSPSLNDARPSGNQGTGKDAASSNQSNEKPSGVQSQGKPAGQTADGGGSPTPTNALDAGKQPNTNPSATNSGDGKSAVVANAGQPTATPPKGQQPANNASNSSAPKDSTDGYDVVVEDHDFDNKPAATTASTQTQVKTKGSNRPAASSGPRSKFPSLNVPYDSLDQTQVVYRRHVEENMIMIERILNGHYDLEDSTVLHVLNRHKDWTDLAVVMDWTGSMYAYGAQVIRWHDMNLRRKALKYLTIFNDGDDNLRQDHTALKPLGNTGGLYFIEPSDIDEIIEGMKAAMVAGDGGDLPENNMEATLKTIEKYPAISRVLMIADKKSAVRDIALLRSIKKPVYIIPCGLPRVIHPDYVTIAWKTGGALLLDDFEYYFEKPEMEIKGNVLKLDKVKYRFNPLTRTFAPVMTAKLQKELAPPR